MRYVTELHRRFESEGVPFVYVSFDWRAAEASEAPSP